jgi:hypothetical protein
MKWIGNKNIGMLLLAIWLIATGVTNTTTSQTTDGHLFFLLASL